MDKSIQQEIFEKCIIYCSEIFIYDYKVQKTNNDGTSLDILYKISKISDIECISIKIGEKVNVYQLKENDFFKNLYIELVPLLREININNILN